MEGKTVRSVFGKNERYVVLSYLSVNHALTHAALIAISPLIPFILESGIGLTIDRALTFAGISLLSYGLGSIPAGYLSDRAGNFKVMLAGVTLTAFSSIGLYFTRNQEEMIAFLVLLGFAAALYHPPGLSLISQSFKKGRGTAMGIHGAIGNVGQIATPVVAVVVAQAYSWQAFYILLAVFAAILMVVTVVFIVSGTEKRVEITEYSEASMKLDALGYHSELRSIFTITLANIMILLAFTSIYYQGTVYILPTYIVNVLLTSKETSGYLTSVMLTSGAVGALVGGRLEDRLGIRKPLIALTALSAASFVPILFASSVEMLALGLVALGFGFFSAQPLTNSLIAEVSAKHVRGFYYGITFLTRDGMGIIPLAIMGYIAMEYSIGGAMYVSVAFAIVALASTFFIAERPSPKKLEKQMPPQA